MAHIGHQLSPAMAEKERAKVRISKSLSDGEKVAIASRKQEVKKGLAKLGIQCDTDQIPNITVLGSGGALRAMIALYGTLAELKKYQFLDCIMYLAGVSGSTWCLSALYRTEDWVQKIELLEKHQCEKLANSKIDLKMAKRAVIEASKDELYSLTDFWSYFIVHKLLKEFDESELSAHRRSCETGKNPYPIYAAVDKKTYLKQNRGTWFEFTPHEAGVPGLGAYVDIKHFGSVFEKGQLYEKKKGKNICYLQGLWGSALGSEKEVIKTMSGALVDFPKDDSQKPDSSTESSDQDTGIIGRAYQAVLELLLCSSDEKIDEKLFDNLESILKDHSGSKSYGLLKGMRQIWLTSDPEKRKKECMMLGKALDIDFGGVKEIETKLQPDSKNKASGGHFHTMVKKTYSCLLGWTWGSTNNFLYQCSDVKFPELTNKEVVSLIDAGLAINTAYPLVLHPERQAKLILSFDFSAGDPFETIKKAAEYCKEHGMPFPKIDERELQDTDDPSDCYIFKGENAPTVMHFPLFNKFNCPGKVAEYRDQFGTFKMSYSKEEIEKLLTAAKKNVAHNHQKILEEIKRVACPLSQKA
ncbi:cytosolic phospholipase A2 gamma-like [Hemicordylus capensis]|uniref:cytosolic phospholipase A2 gamma-like n=1 Tax=Hemicordylus capensis TaxID=884348 RepID=UPI00230287D9|nr:cytosolic phospholipase A2 gamma-like [Hemicordylus capensis]XP_053121238.1 cytosolic phospholipase A2 gamma-like [Hemicordylus capensis]XP_053121239.1 cytosolic phospholipase A2 gamma-like [Hemicordylus capensis]